MRILNKALCGLAVGLAGAAAALLIWRAGWFDQLEYATWAWRVRAGAHPGAATPEIKIILLDQASLDWGKNDMGLSWPWPREVYSAVLAFCRRGGAKVTAFDVIFSEPSVYGAADDRAFGAALAARPDNLAAVFLGEETGELTAWPAEPRVSAALVDGRGPQNTGAAAAERATFPVPEIATNAALLANVSDIPDEDGVFRRAALFREFDGRAMLSLGAAAFIAGERAAGRDPEAVRDRTALRVDGRAVRVDASGRAILRYRGPSQTHQTFGAASVIQSELALREGAEPSIPDPSVFRDCFVLFGFSAPGLMDLRPTPVSRVYPGVEVHATVLDNLLSGDFIRMAGGWATVLGVVLGAAAAGMGVTLGKRARHSVAAFALFLPLPVVAGFFAYRAGVWWPMVCQEASVLLALIGGVVVNYATEGRQKAFIKQAFRHYLSAEVIEKIISDPDSLRLGGERRQLSIFFSDLQGFSSIAEKLDPVALTGLLNEYLTEMTDIVFDEGGTLDKYEGDAIVAFWNAPLGQADHAARACRAALKCQRRLQEINPGLARRYGVELKMRIGLNTGDVVVGNMGSRTRFNYTILGDAANLASRLEGANKVFGTSIMVSEATWLSAGSFSGRELGRIRVVGRRTPVRVFELAGFGSEPTPDSYEACRAGLEACCAGRLDDAVIRFEQAPGDTVCGVYAAECRRRIEEGAGPWDGVWNLTEK